MSDRFEEYLKMIEDTHCLYPENAYVRTVKNLENYSKSVIVPADIKAIMVRIKDNTISLDEIVEIKTKIDGYKTGTELDNFIIKLFRNPEINEEQKKEELLSILETYYQNAQKRENKDNER